MLRVTRSVGACSTAMGRRLLAGACLTALTALSLPAMAQDVPAPKPNATAAKPVAAASDTGGIETVVVTARYVKEDIQETPIAITAQSQDQLRAANVTNLSSLGAVVPNLWTQPGDTQSAGTPRVRLRGVAQGDSSSLAVPPAIAIYTDDVYHATTAGSELDFTDIDHIEVERGPQSTLNGNASIGGAIKLYTKDPTGDGSGFLSFAGGSRDKVDASGAYDLSITPTLSARLSGHFVQQDGYVQRLDFTCEMQKLGTPALAGNFPLLQPTSVNHGCVVGHLGGIQHSVGQAKLRWQPTDKIDLLLTFSQHIEHDEETPEVALSYTGSTASNVLAYQAAVQATYGAAVVLDNRFVAPPGTGGYASYATDCRPDLPTLVGTPSGFCYPQGKTAYSTLASAKLHYQITDDIGMTAIGAYTQYSNAFTQNGDQSPLGYVISHFENTDFQYTGEVRFDGKLFDDKLNWVAGAFFMDLTGRQNNFIGTLLITQPNSRVRGTNETESGFFHLDYSITDKWRVSGGARFTSGDIGITINNPGFVSILTPVHSKQSRWDWLLSTDYKITDDILAYANAATGSRPPGLTTIVSTPRQLQATPAESLTSYEAGLKTEFFDHRLRMNVDGFYEDYSKLSATARYFECLGQPGAVATPFKNITDCNQFAPNNAQAIWNISVAIPATVAGAEWDITAVPIDGLRIDWAGGYNAFQSGIKTPGATGYYFPGNHRQPTWNQHADVAYDVETGIGTFTPRVDWIWQSQQDFNPAPNTSSPAPVYIVKPYSLWNAQIDYHMDDSNWTATLAVTNLGDKFYYYQMFPQTLDNQTRLAPPREIVFTVRRDF